MRLVNFNNIHSRKLHDAIGISGAVQTAYIRCFNSYINSFGIDIYEEFIDIFTRSELLNSLNNIKIMADGIYIYYPYDRYFRYLEHGGENHRAFKLITKVAKKFGEVF